MYEGWLLHTGHRSQTGIDSPEGQAVLLKAEAGGDGRDRDAFLWRVRALAEAGVVGKGRLDMMPMDAVYRRNCGKYWTPPSR